MHTLQSARIEGAGAAEIVGSVALARWPAALEDGTLLPPVRALADQLGLNRNTVAAAYRLLAERGVVEGRGRGGTVVALPDAAPGEGRPVALPSGRSGRRQSGSRGCCRTCERLARSDTSLRCTARPRCCRRCASARRVLFAGDVDEPYGLSVTHGAVDAIERLLATISSAATRSPSRIRAYLAHISTLRLNGFAAESVAWMRPACRPDGLERRTPRRSARGDLHAARAESHRREPDARARGGTARRAGPPPAGARHRGRPSLAWGRRGVRAHSLVSHGAVGFGALDGEVARFGLRVAVVASDPRTEDQLRRRLVAGVNWVSHLLQGTVAALLVDPATPQLLERRTRRVLAANRAPPGRAP